MPYANGSAMSCAYMCTHAMCKWWCFNKHTYPHTKWAPGSVAQASVKPRVTGQTAGSQAPQPGLPPTGLKKQRQFSKNSPAKRFF